MPNFIDGVIFMAASPGGGDFVVSSAVQGFMIPSQAGVIDGAVYRYRAETVDMAQWEIGYGAYSVGTGTLSRSTVLHNSLGNTAKIAFSVAPSVGLVPLKMDLAEFVTETDADALYAPFVHLHTSLHVTDFSVAARAAVTGGPLITVSSVAPSSPAINDVWIDTN